MWKESCCILSEDTIPLLARKDKGKSGNILNMVGFGG
jgi:hypothetical protein